MKLSVCMSAAMFVAGCEAQPSLPEQGERSIGDLIVTPKSVDFGTVVPGEECERRLTFRNTGPVDVSVRLTDISCDCLSFQELPILVAAGTSGEIVVVFDSAKEPGFVGDLTLTASLETSNISTKGRVLLEFRVSVRAATPDIGRSSPTNPHRGPKP